MRKIFNIETSSDAEWTAILNVIKESFDDKYFTEFEISVPYKIYNSVAFHEWLEEVMRECRVNPSYRFWRFDEHIMTSDASYRNIIFRKAYVEDEESNDSKSEVEELRERNKRLMADNVLLKTLHDEHCENQRKEITLLLKQKAKLEKELEACKNHQIDMLAYRDDIIEKITREKNELENANMAQTRYIKETEENMKKGNEQYKKLNEQYKKLKDVYYALKFNKFSSDEKNFDIIKRANEVKNETIHELVDNIVHLRCELKAADNEINELKKKLDSKK